MLKFLTVTLFTALAVAGTSEHTPSHPYRVILVDGDGALNSLPSRSAREPVVRVADASGKPITGARVEFDAVRGEGKQFELSRRHSGEQRQAPQEFDLVIEQHGFLHTPIPGRSLRHFISRRESGQ